MHTLQWVFVAFDTIWNSCIGFSQTCCGHVYSFSKLVSFLPTDCLHKSSYTLKMGELPCEATDLLPQSPLPFPDVQDTDLFPYRYIPFGCMGHTPLLERQSGASHQQRAMPANPLVRVL